MLGSGERIAVGTTDGEVLCIDTASGRLLWSRVAHPGGLTALSPLPSTAQFLSGGEDGVIHCYSSAEPPPIWSTQLEGGWVDAIAATPGGNLAVGCGRRLYLLSPGSGECIRHQEFEARIVHIGFDESESMLVVATTTAVMMVSFPDGEKLRDIPFAATPQVVRLAPNGSHVLVGLSDRSLRFVRLEEDEEVGAGLGPFRCKPSHVEWLTPPNQLLFADIDRAFVAVLAELDRFLDSDDQQSEPLGSAIRRIPSADGRPSALAIHPTGNFFAIASNLGHLVVQNLTSDDRLLDITMLDSSMVHLAWLPNGRQLFYADASGTIGLLEISRADPLQ